jgi:chloride channel 3/4/5
VAGSLIGILTAVVAFGVDVAQATISDYKIGYCSVSIFKDREQCCANKNPVLGTFEDVGEKCTQWIMWTDEYWTSYAIYVAFALLFGIIAGSVTMTTKASLPAVEQHHDADYVEASHEKALGKTMYMAAGSGIPEIKTILSGFVIPGFLSWKVLLVKAIGSTFAVATGMCLGKEGPFVHISTCAGYLVANLFPKYQENGRKMREMLSVACSAGLSVAFGAPIGGVLFSYEVS